MKKNIAGRTEHNPINAAFVNGKDSGINSHPTKVGIHLLQCRPFLEHGCQKKASSFFQDFQQRTLITQVRDAVNE
jgi:hypothetical protein